jgi:hypothetical protein
VLFIFKDGGILCEKMATVSSGASLYCLKLSIITSCSDILLLMQKQCYIMLSTVSKSVEIQRVLTVIIIIFFRTTEFSPFPSTRGVSFKILYAFS